MNIPFYSKKAPKPAEDPNAPLLVVDGVSKAFERPILIDVSLTVGRGETLAVLGKSGTGKSVLLKLIIGLLEPEKGKIQFDGEEITRLTEEKLTQLRKRIGFLFQGGALFDSMTVGENLDLYLSKHTELPPEEREQKIITALSTVDLDNVIDKMPSELSGGMRKRAGLARSIVLEPELMLYDEPTTGLDPVTAASIAELILTLQQKLGIASLVVTHDLPTAFTVCDRAVVLNEGHKIFDGHIEELQQADDDFLHQYLAASRLDRKRRDDIIATRARIKSPIAASVTNRAAPTRESAPQESAPHESTTREPVQS